MVALPTTTVDIRTSEKVADKARKGELDLNFLSMQLPIF